MSSNRDLAYARWREMVLRCTSPKHKNWKDYGGRGITVSARWLDFSAYYADTGDKPAPGMTIDRIDNDGSYGPDNWRWATRAEQRQNQRAAVTRRRAATATHCRQGHPFNEQNTYRWHERRVCRECRRERDRNRPSRRNSPTRPDRRISITWPLPGRLEF